MNLSPQLARPAWFVARSSLTNLSAIYGACTAFQGSESEIAYGRNCLVRSDIALHNERVTIRMALRQAGEEIDRHGAGYRDLRFIGLHHGYDGR